MNVAILGFGSQGASALAYWQAQGHEITICDINDSLENPGVANLRTGNNYLTDLGQFDLLVRSPSVHPRDIVAANDEAILDKVTTNTNEFMRVCPTKNIIGVTGTKGKGTTCMLIARMLVAAGYRVHIGGNIGTPPLEMLKADIRPDDYVVLELANFQLIDIKYSPHIAACLMIEPEHMNWHTDLEEYVTAKQQLFRWQKPGDIAIYYAENKYSKSAAEISPGAKVPYFATPGAIVSNRYLVIGGTQICSVDDIKLLGRHNWQNICAALTALWQVTQDTGAAQEAIRTFSGLPYRLEFIREVDSVKYYNDSFGTTPETAIVALQAFTNPKVVILGGSDKAADYTALAKTVAVSNVRAVIAIGMTGPKISEILREAGFNNIIEGLSSMAEMVAEARKHTQPGDIVLLSTACASFGLFKNYKDRGEQFNQVVRSLA